jgi:type I restriction enzyme M protein
VTAPRSILDLGCGEGALASAARLRWNRAEIITVDIDNDSKPNLRVLQDGMRGRHRHVVADALDPLLGIHARLKAESVDLAICNPPFHRPKWRAGFGEILEAAGLSEVVKNSREVTSDLLFIAQNMRYLSKNGEMGLIVPDAIITGERMLGVRKALANQIEKVVQLPRTAFTNTEAQTFILIIARGRQNEAIELRELTQAGDYSPPLVISADHCSRLDYRFHLSAKQHSKQTKLRTLADLGVKLQRGRLSSVETKAANFNTFHTADFKRAENGTISLGHRKYTIAKGQSVARKGDILVARVDRNLEHKVVLVKSGSAAISDCVYKLSCPEDVQDRVFKGLRARTGRSQIQALARGNGAKHISATSLMKVLV